MHTVHSDASDNSSRVSEWLTGGNTYAQLDRNRSTRGGDDDEEEMASEGSELRMEVELAVEPNIPYSMQHFSIRSMAVGVLVGGLMCFSNMYFGLQTGWVTMGSLQSTIIGFGIFKLVRPSIHLGPMENVVLQSTAVAAATLPLAAGFVGIIPALQILPQVEGGPVALTIFQQVMWCLALAFFGVFFAVPLRKQTILREKLPFPSGTATAQMIRMLHSLPAEPVLHAHHHEREVAASQQDWRKKWHCLLIAFIVSSVNTLLAFFVHFFHSIPVLSWIGLGTASMWGWTITPSLSYAGQGMIMGTRTAVSMLAGAVVGWGILGPIALGKGWVKSISTGSGAEQMTNAKGWLMWVALSMMLAESIVSLLILLYKSVRARRQRLEIEADEDPAPKDQQVPAWWWMSGLGVSTVLCIAVLSPMFHMPVYEPGLAVLISLFCSLLAVRALGETDLNPVNGLGKISQLVFAGISPGNVVANLIAGAIAEAGATQAGDMMQDLKTGHLIRASPRAQFYGQCIGSFFSAIFTVAAFQLYMNAFGGTDTLPIPMAGVWLGMAELVTGGVGQLLSIHVMPFCIVFTILGTLLPVLDEILPEKVCHFIPSGVAFSVGMLIPANYVLPRAVGGVLGWIWQRRNPNQYEKYMIVLASGFVLGEGVCSILTAIMKSAGVRTF